MALIRVLQYNVLCDKLALQPDYFFKCQKDDLKADIRLKRIFSKFKPLLAEQPVICLQELSRNWSGKFHTWAQNRNYHMVSSLYGSYFNDYMGVAILFDNTKYRLVDSHVSKVSDAREPWPRPPAAPRGFFGVLFGYISACLSGIFSTVSDVLLWLPRFFGFASYPKESQITNAKNRHNTFIALRLRERATNAEFVVGTYHMPCAFTMPQVMTMHAAMVAQQLQAFANGTPCILCTDLNGKPGSPEYTLLTNGEVRADQQAALPDLPADFPWQPKIKIPFVSSYARKDGHEPAFTNLAFTGQDLSKPVFKDCLDYIFVTPDIDVHSVDKLPLAENDNVESFPTATEPSDHLMLGATLRIPIPSEASADPEYLTGV
eukprot:gnl/Spiro4/9064_TR4780_c0_g1_i1.p1 gnl/Spiro4/9064_TR4780_c0_g1~~gnl/Spiro4/9064_TR4780_c0_g1_i1.p1  ORF type:complete len:393 (+),score=116.65 gnl/Spiro4/9064_TR4780_c0_g1_i1:56-1180(+)